MMKFIIFLLLIVTGVSSLCAQQKVDKKSLDAALETLRKESKIPLKLPTYFPYKPFSTAAEKRRTLFARTTTTDDGFELDFCFSVTTCNGAYFYAELSGEAITGNSEKPTGKVYILDRGFVGYYEKFSCGVSCTPGNLTWDQDGYRYIVFMNEDKVSTLIKFVNSAINNLSVNQPGAQSESSRVETASVEEFLKSTVSAGDKLEIEAKGDLNGDSLADWAGVIQRKKNPPFRKGDMETNETLQLYILLQQKQGGYRIAGKSKETGSFGLGAIYVEDLEIRKSSLFLQVNGSSGYWTVYQFRPENGEWRLIGWKENKIDPSEDKLFSTDRNLLTGTVIETRQKGERKPVYKRYRKNFPRFYLSEFNLFGWNNILEVLNIEDILEGN